MQIWADADALPGPIRDILFRAAERTSCRLVLVANKELRVPRSKFIRFQRVQHGADVADGFIVQEMEAGDLVITADIPLAALVVEKGGLALDPRGELYTTDNIKAILNMRDFMDTLRSSGIETGGPAPLNQSERQDFANQLDKYLTKHNKQ